MNQEKRGQVTSDREEYSPADAEVGPPVVPGEIWDTILEFMLCYNEDFLGEVIWDFGSKRDSRVFYRSVRNVQPEMAVAISKCHKRAW